MSRGESAFPFDGWVGLLGAFFFLGWLCSRPSSPALGGLEGAAELQLITLKPSPASPTSPFGETYRWN